MAESGVYRPGSYIREIYPRFIASLPERRRITPEEVVETTTATRLRNSIEDSPSTTTVFEVNGKTFVSQGIMARFDLIDAATTTNEAEEEEERRRTGQGLIMPEPIVEPEGTPPSMDTFTIKFCDPDIDDSMMFEYFPAVRGVCLSELLHTPCIQRNIDPLNVRAYLDYGNYPLPLLITDTRFLGGKIVCVYGSDCPHVRRKMTRLELRRERHKRMEEIIARKKAQEENKQNQKEQQKEQQQQQLQQLQAVASTSTASQTQIQALALQQQAKSSKKFFPKVTNSTSPVSTQTTEKGFILSRKTSKSFKGKGSRFFSGSTDESGESSRSFDSRYPLKIKSPKWGIFSGFKHDSRAMEALSEKLDHFGKTGIPCNDKFMDYAEDYETAVSLGIYSLEDDWRDALVEIDLLPDNLIQQQTALWELIATEASYIRIIRVVTDLFQTTLYHLQEDGLLTEVDGDCLFSNIREIYDIHRFFWNEILEPMLIEVREYGALLDSNFLLGGFLRFNELFQPYAQYCLDQQQISQQYCRDKMHESELFIAFLTWCESQKECKRLKLLDLMVKPMERLTKYSLLLKAVHKVNHIQDVLTDLDMMVRIQAVTNFVNSVNSSMRECVEIDQLKNLSTRIENYDMFEYAKEEEIEKLLKLAHPNELNLIAPMPGCNEEYRRELFIEGALIMREHNKKIDVYVFLFTDMLLLCKKKSNDRFKLLKPPYLTDRLMMVESNRENHSGIVYLYFNEYNSPMSFFTLTVVDRNQTMRGWWHALIRAQSTYQYCKRLSLEIIVSNYLTADDDDERPPSRVRSTTRSPFNASSIGGSRTASLIHSHSGSVEMTDTSGQSRGVSIELEVGRGSSISSEEGSSSAELRLTLVTSPNATTRIQDKRSPLKSPNMLVVKSINQQAGQSLPNLLMSENSCIATGIANPGTTSISFNSGSLLSVPTSKLNPSHRGVSYPPPSPRGLRRSYALPQSRNPPLQKARHVLSVRSATEAETSIDIPTTMPGTSPPRNPDEFQSIRYRVNFPKSDSEKERKLEIPTPPARLCAKSLPNTRSSTPSLSCESIDSSNSLHRPSCSSTTTVKATIAPMVSVEEDHVSHELQEVEQIVAQFNIKMKDITKSAEESVARSQAHSFELQNPTPSTSGMSTTRCVASTSGLSVSNSSAPAAPPRTPPPRKSDLRRMKEVFLKGSAPESTDV